MVHFLCKHVSFMLTALAIAFVFVQGAGVSASPVSERKTFEGFIKLKLDGIDREVDIFVRYTPPVATPQNPDPVVFANLNGLTYTTDSWAGIVQDQLNDGDGVLLFDFLGQGRTLLANQPLNYELACDTQTQIVEKLIAASGPLGIPEQTRKVLFGVSYGGAIILNFLARNPNANVEGVAAAPYVRPIDQMDRKIRDQIAMLNLNPFFAGIPFEDKYKMLLWQDIFLYPWLEPTLLRLPMDLTFQAVHALVFGMHSFSATQFLDKIPKEKLHGVIAGRDQYINDDVKNFFLKTVGVENMASLLLIEPAEHKISEAAPKTQAHWLKLIARQDPRIYYTGQMFEAKTDKGIIVAGNTQVSIEAPKEAVRSQSSIWFENLTDALMRWPRVMCQGLLVAAP